jgi:outer membrane biosynthesis protein TonB
MARKKVEVPTREELIQATEELNNVLGLDPPIKVSKKMTDEELIEKIKEIATDNVYESDCIALSDEDVEGEHFYSEGTVEVFGALGIEIAAGSPPNPEEAQADEEKEDEPEPEVEEKPVKSKKEKAAPAEKPAKEKKEKAPAKEKSKSVTRTDCFCNALLAIDKKGKSIDDIAEEIDEAYVKGGGKSNLKQTLHMIKVYLPVLVGVKFAKFDNKVITLI